MDIGATVTSPQWQTVPAWDPVAVLTEETASQNGSRPSSESDATTGRVFFKIDRSSNPWVGKKLSLIESMRRLKKNWHAFGSSPPNELSIEIATSVIRAAAEFDFEPTGVDPSVDDGVCISFRRGKKYADIECFNSGEILAAESTGGNTEIWDVEDSESGIDGALARILDFISKQ